MFFFIFHFYLGYWLVIASKGSPFLYLVIYDTHHNINRSLSHLSPSLAFIFSRSFLLRTAPHYLNAWNRLI